MAKGFVIAVLTLLATVSARPEPQFLFSTGPYYGTGAAYTAPAAPVAPVIPAAIPAAVPAYTGYPGLVSMAAYAYSYGYQNNFAEVPVVNPSANLVYNSAYNGLPYASSLPYTYVPATTYLK